MSLASCTRAQLPVLEASLRQWRISSLGALESDSSQRRRIEREVGRLLSGLTQVREELSRGQDTINAVHAVMPFIDVARSPLVGTEAKSAAVECLGRLVEWLHVSDEGVVEALSAATEAVLECRFEQTDSGADEVAMMWLLETLGSCTRLSKVGILLPEDTIVRVIETLYDGCTVPYYSDSTRAIALRVTSTLISELFSMAPFGDENAGSLELSSSETPVSATTSTGAGLITAARKTFQLLVEMADPERPNPHVGTYGRLVALRLLWEASFAATTRPTAKTRSSLRIMKDTFIEGIIKDDLMRSLLQIVQTVGSGALPPILEQDPHRLRIISESLRLINALLGNHDARRELKTQFECLFNAVFARVLEKSASRKIPRLDEAVLVIESFCDLLSDPTILGDCYAAFDLQLQRTDVFESTFNLFSRLAFPHQLSVPALDTIRLLSLRGLLVSLRSLTFIGDTALENVDAKVLAEEERHVKELKARKLALRRCAEAFNAKPKQGLKALMDESILSDPPDPLIFASFLRNTPVLDKVAIGQFLGEDGELNRAVLKAFTETFNFTDRSLVSALRIFLECFRLPKEAQQIDRVVQVFADVAVSQCADGQLFPSVDACYILCFAIIMLNTDLHNPNIRPEKKMTEQQFVQTNRNYGQEVSKGVDLPADFLKRVYADIATKEINTMKDGTGVTAEISTDRWYDILMRTRSDAKLDASEISRPGAQVAFKKAMFETVWRSSLAAVSVMFDSGQASEQPDALHSALDGFLTLAKAAARFRCLDALDSILASLCKFTSLLTYGSMQLDLVDRSKAHQNALRDFGNQHKGQMAAMSVFALARRFGSDVRISWRHILRCILRMSDLGLLSEQFVSEDSVSLDATSRMLFHRKVREAVAKQNSRFLSQLPGAKASGGLSHRGILSETNASNSSSWNFTSWLFGSDSDPMQDARARLELDPDYRAFMSALRVADALSARSGKVSSASASSTSGASGLQSPTGKGGSDSVASSPSSTTGHGHHHKFLEAGDVLDDNDADDIFGRMDDASSGSAQFALECARSCRPFTLVGDSKQLSEPALSSFIEATFDALGLVIETASDSAAENEMLAPHSPPRPQSSPSPSQEVSARSTPSPKVDLDLGVLVLSPPSSGSRLVAMHILAELVIRNVHRLPGIFPKAVQGLFEVLKSTKQPSFHVEVACVSIIRMTVAALPVLPEQAVGCLHALCEYLPIAPGLDFLLGKTVLDLVADVATQNGEDSSGLWTRTADGKRVPRCGWSELRAVFEALGAASPVAAAFAFDALKLVVTSSEILLQARTAADCARTASVLASVKWAAGEQQTREVGVSDLIGTLLDSTPALLARSEATLTSKEHLQEERHLFVTEVFFPMLQELAKLAQNVSAAPGTHKRALQHLQRACVNSGLALQLSDEEWLALVEGVVFTACSGALRMGETGPASPLVAAAGETKTMTAACELLAKTLLAVAPKLASQERFPQLWVEVLQYLERFKQAGLLKASSGEADGMVLTETVTEQTKNLLLSLSTRGILSPLAKVVALGQPLDANEARPPPNAPSSLLWEMSWAVLDRSPGLKGDLFGVDDVIDLREEAGQEEEPSPSSEAAPEPEETTQDPETEELASEPQETVHEVEEDVEGLEVNESPASSTESEVDASPAPAETEVGASPAPMEERNTGSDASEGDGTPSVHEESRQEQSSLADNEAEEPGEGDGVLVSSEDVPEETEEEAPKPKVDKVD